MSPAEKTLSQKAVSKKRRQLITIGVLLVILVIAIVTGPASSRRDGDGGSIPAAGLVSLKPSLAKPLSDEQLQAMETLSRTRDDLNSIARPDLLSLDLFLCPAEPKLAPVEEHMAAPSMPDKTVIRPVLGAIYGAYSGENRKALLGEEVVSSGAETKSGVIVLEVSGEGVRISSPPRKSANSQ